MSTLALSSSSKMNVCVQVACGQVRGVVSRAWTGVDGRGCGLREGNARRRKLNKSDSDITRGCLALPALRPRGLRPLRRRPLWPKLCRLSHSRRQWHVSTPLPCSSHASTATNNRYQFSEFAKIEYEGSGRRASWRPNEAHRGGTFPTMKSSALSLCRHRRRSVCFVLLRVGEALTMLQCTFATKLL